MKFRNFILFIITLVGCSGCYFKTATFTRFLNTKEMASFMSGITKISQNITVSVGKYTMTIDISINLMAKIQDVFMVISQIEMTRLRRL